MIDPEAILTADYIIHLADAGIGDKRWTKKRRQLISDSRIKTCKLLFGKMSGIVLNGSRVSAGKIISAGYNFEFPDLESALKNLFPVR